MRGGVAAEVGPWGWFCLGLRVEWDEARERRLVARDVMAEGGRLCSCERRWTRSDSRE